MAVEADQGLAPALDLVDGRTTSEGILAITVTPGTPDSAELADIAEPRRDDGQLLVDMIALGVCGTDREIVSGEYGWPPPGERRLVLGHESLGRVAEAPAGSELKPGDLVAGIVRRPDPEPCPCCARGEFDMCRNGRYRERGIKELDGYGAQRVVLEADYAIKVDPALGSLGVLVEPASVVAKAWEQADHVITQGCRPLASVLVTGAGPIGLLAALLDRAADGPKPALVEALGARYYSATVREACASSEPDIVIDCTGAPEVVVDAVQTTAPGAVVCLTGISPRGRTLTVDVGTINNELVLENDVVLGSVNANHRHFDDAARALAAADPRWLGRMITRRVPLERWSEALERHPTDVKTVIEFPTPLEGAQA